MFKRKSPHTGWKKFKQFVWPDMGWGRFCQYLWKRLIMASQKTSAESVAAGLAFGWSISFNPLIGTHTFWILAFSWLTKTNFLAAMIGSLVGNIWTFPAFLYVSYTVGHFVTDFFYPSEAIKDVDAFNFGTLEEAMASFWDVFIPTLIGWPFMAVISFAVTYPIYYVLVSKAQKAYQKHKKDNKKKNVEELYS